MKYKVLRESDTLGTYTYFGYIDDEYAGCVTGLVNAKYFDIIHSQLETKFRGNKAVRALYEILEVISDNHDVIRTRIDNKDNGEIKMMLNAGFHIIGTVTYGSEIAVELLKIREN
jgi:hypothetical protein